MTEEQLTIRARSGEIVIMVGGEPVMAMTPEDERKLARLIQYTIYEAGGER